MNAQWEFYTWLINLPLDELGETIAKSVPFGCRLCEEKDSRGNCICQTTCADGIRKYFTTDTGKLSLDNKKAILWRSLKTIRNTEIEQRWKRAKERIIERREMENGQSNGQANANISAPF